MRLLHSNSRIIYVTLGADPGFLESGFIYMGLILRKPVFEVPLIARLKPSCSATETGDKIEILLVAG